MDNQVNIRKALRVFHIITARGERFGSEYRLNGVSAISDFEGYTATLKNDYVCLDIFFHNKYSLNFSNRKELAKFLDKITKLDSGKLYVKSYAI